MRHHLPSSAAVALGLALPGLTAPALAQTYDPGASSAWFSQIGLSTAIQAEANGGGGISIGLVDSGVSPGNAELTGRVSGLSGCTVSAVSCALTGFIDNNGHGTATASIAAGSTASGARMSGVAPSATIIEQKALNSLGAGTAGSVANGIIAAANAGAQIINLSISYDPTSSVVNAINYAANLGAIIVFAGGNNAARLNGGLNTTGLTATALNRLVFAGSVTGANSLSSFSNIPGTASAVSGTSQASYASLWLMAPGENILAPDVGLGPSRYAYWTGTSMSAPQVSGALALLVATWPVLLHNGTATSLLFKTATDLGQAGVDSLYGNGLLNLTAAFQPQGALTVTQSNGRSTTLGGTGPSLLVGGPLGALRRLYSLMSSYTAFDSYQRNYQADLSGLMARRTTTATAALVTASAPTVTSTSVRHLDGGTLTLSSAVDDLPSSQALPSHYGFTGQNHGGLFGGSADSSWLMSFRGDGGTTLMVGQGYPATASFAEALWGGDHPGSEEARLLGVSNGLLSLAEGGSFAAYGGRIGEATRLAASLMQTRPRDMVMGGNNWQTPNAAAAGLGLSTRLAEGWSGAVTLGALNERDGLLGTSYDGNGLLALGNQNRSLSVGISTSFDLGGRTGLMLDAAIARSEGGGVADGLFTHVTPLLARAYGISLVQRDALAEGDSLTLGLRQPLRVVSGAADIATTTVDAQGYATTAPTRLKLTPDGSESDLVLGYRRPLGNGMSLESTAILSNDAENIRGNVAAGIHIGFSLAF